MKNIFRTREYMKLARCIKTCLNSEQLETLRELVLKYHKQRGRDSAELLAVFAEKESDLSFK